MKMFILLIALVPFFALAQSGNVPSDLNQEVVNHPGEKISVQERAKIPQSILVKKDENGKLFVLESKGLLAQINETDVKDLDKLNFVPIEQTAKIKTGDVVPSITKLDELDQDTPRQSWYVYWNYNPYPYYYSYYVPIYYYYNYYSSYNYYPYYAYNYSGCNYYWYRAW